MRINGKYDPFDQTQAKAKSYELLDTFPVKQGITTAKATKYIRTIQTSSKIKILNFLHDGEGELELFVDSPFTSAGGVLNWDITWDDTKAIGKIKVYGSK